MNTPVTEPDETLIDQLKALAHPLRFRIIDALRGGERNVGEIEEVTGIGQPGLSQQLGILRKASLVQTRKEAKLVFYSLDKPSLALLGDCFDRLSEREGPQLAKTRRPAPGAANFARLA